MAEQIVINNGIKTYEIVNQYNEHVTDLIIDTKDKTLQNKFMHLIKRATDLSNVNINERKEILAKANLTEEEFKKGSLDGAQLAAVDALIESDTKATAGLVEEMAALFGERFIKEYFKDNYEFNPDFIPTAQALADMLAEVAPTIEAVLRQNSAAGAKYTPNRRIY